MPNLLCAKTKPRLVVVSPFLDKRHGTERRVAEWISRLTGDFDIHVYSQRVEDIDLSNITWHRVPRLPGPHLLNYIWWFAGNHARRSWDRRFRGIRADLVFSPGINCLDADVVSVHVVFAEYLKQFVQELRFSRQPVSRWPQILHRTLYYRLVTLIERWVYRNPETVLILIARRTAAELERALRAPEAVSSNLSRTRSRNLQSGAALRCASKARKELGYSDRRFVLLLIGNHWAIKVFRFFSKPWNQSRIADRSPGRWPRES